MKHAIIKNNIVSNIIVWDSGKNPEYRPDGTAIQIDGDIFVSVGWLYSGGKFIDPNPAQDTGENQGQ